jgi:MFS family permease
VPRRQIIQVRASSSRPSVFTADPQSQIFLTLSAATACALIDQSTLAVAIPTISSALGSGTQSAWISSAYFLTSTSFQLLYGRISDIGASCFGRGNALQS